jgi:GDPmannose 4,6-dehydratase
MIHQNKRALICGITGQDGSYLAKYLLSIGYDVWGTSRDVAGNALLNLKTLGILDKVTLLNMSPEDFRSVYSSVKVSKPNEIYYLSGQSSVGLSFDLPAETIRSIVLGVLNILEACKMTDSKIKLYHAGSSEVFGNTNGYRANEKTLFQPESPYAVAKASANWLVNNYRQSYGIFACNGLLFNHESFLRPDRFVTMKIIKSAHRIANGSSESLTLGNLNITRDWGWAEDYVVAMWKMLQLEDPEDFVIATGESFSLEEFTCRAFENFNLDWKQHVLVDKKLYRPSDILVSKADPSKAMNLLNWSANIKGLNVVDKMTSYYK